MPELIKLGDGDPAGGDEVLLVKADEGWLAILPWGYDYGSGFETVILLTEDEKNSVLHYSEPNSWITTEEFIRLFPDRPNLIDKKEKIDGQFPDRV